MIWAPYGEAFTFEIPVPKSDGAFATSSDWTPASGDVKISKDGGAVANITTLPTAVTGTGAALWTFSVSATEMQAAQVTIQVIDTALTDNAITIFTFGNGSGHVAGDFDVILAQSFRDAMKLAPTAGSPATGSVDKHLDDIESGQIAAADVWSASPRTLTSGAAQSGDVTGVDGTFTRTRGNTWDDLVITGLGSVSGYSKLFFTVKPASTFGSVEDTASTIQIALYSPSSGDGLLYINGGAAGTAANGAIVVDDAGAGDLTITLEAVESAKLTPGNYKYDIQMIDGSGDVTTLQPATDFIISADVTRATS